MFNEICSIYAHAKDNKGKFVDMETGEMITEMTIREFCLTDRWKPQVMCLRDLVARYGSKAKKMQEYIETKKQLPGATPSGRFALWEDDCTAKDGRMYRDVVSRRETHLQQHTGWLVIDIDLGDNASLSNFNNIRYVLEDRPEVALLMRSCSGTGFFGLVHLTNPVFPPEDGERYTLQELIGWHKAQFRALCKEYLRYGVKLDPACSNIGRVRFASWDEPDNIYINERAVAYTKFDYGDDAPLVPKFDSQVARPHGTVAGYGGNDRPYHWWEDQAYILRMTELLVSAMVSGRHSITSDYKEWIRVGWSLKHHPQGEQLFHQLSSLDKNYNVGETAKQWRIQGEAKVLTHSYLFSKCHKALGDDQYRRISNEAWNSR